MFDDLKDSNRVFLLIAFAAAMIAIIALRFGVFGTNGASGNVNPMPGETSAAQSRFDSPDTSINGIVGDILQSLRNDPGAEASEIHGNLSIKDDLNSIETWIRSIDETRALHMLSAPLDAEEGLLFEKFTGDYAHGASGISLPPPF
ncbi:MAG: hypothetical protein FWD77_07195 [Betaproteobacteria bacterium]|nr:hypothetical protein [Betaproteobacteria bacterium]